MNIRVPIAVSSEAPMRAFGAAAAALILARGAIGEHVETSDRLRTAI